MPEDENTEFEAEHINDDEDIQTAEEFFEKFGFSHECRCAEDWATGNLGVVAICYLNMCKEGLETLAEYKTQLEAAQDELAELRIIADEA